MSQVGWIPTTPSIHAGSVLDAEITDRPDDVSNALRHPALLDPLTKKFLSYSRLDQIITEPAQSLYPPLELYGPQPPHRWCYYFEQADLARQRSDWPAIAALGDAAFQSGDYPNEPSERVVFIMGYALSGRWEEAERLSDETLAITALMQPMLCAAWQQIADQADEAGKAGAVSMRERLSCK